MRFVQPIHPSCRRIEDGMQVAFPVVFDLPKEMIDALQRMNAKEMLRYDKLKASAADQTLKQPFPGCSGR